MVSKIKQMKNKILFSTLIISVVMTFCRSTKQNTSYEISYSHETECVTTNMDGTEIVKAWANGELGSAGIEAAKKNAINDVLFKGIIHGKSNCEQIPVVNEVNARKKYEVYFNHFFSAGGAYKKFVDIKDEKTATFSNSTGIVLIIQRSDLIKKLRTDKILNY